jgi:hypothetical protein
MNAKQLQREARRAVRYYRKACADAGQDASLDGLLETESQGDWEKTPWKKVRSALVDAYYEGK